MRRSFDSWELAARVAMADRGIDGDVANPLIDAAKSHWEQSGQGPWEAIGTPEEFAVAAAAERPATERARRDVHGMTPGEYLGAAIFALAVMTIAATLLAAVTRGSLSFPVTSAGLVGTLSFVVCWVSVLGAPGAVRAAGYPQWAPWIYGLGVVQVVATGAAFILLPQDRLGDLPAPLLIAAAAIVIWWQSRARVTRRRTAAQPLTAGPGPGHAEDEHWLRALRGLLIGRHDVPARRAAELVTDARHHLAAAGGSASEEFGPVDEYAAELADSEANRRGPWWRGAVAQLMAMTAATAATAQLAVDYWRAGHGWIAVVAALTALAGVYTVTRLARSAVRQRRLHTG